MGMFNAIDNATFMFLLAFVLVITSVVIYVGDLTYARINTSVSQVLNATIGTDADYVSKDIYETQKSWLVDSIQFFTIIVLGAAFVSSLFSYETGVEVYFQGFIVSFIFTAIFLYMTQMVMAYIYSIFTGLTIDGITFTFSVFPQWFMVNLSWIIVLNLIASALGVFLKPAPNIQASVYG